MSGGGLRVAAALLSVSVLAFAGCRRAPQAPDAGESQGATPGNVLGRLALRQTGHLMKGLGVLGVLGVCFTPLRARGRGRRIKRGGFNPQNTHNPH